MYSLHIKKWLWNASPEGICVEKEASSSWFHFSSYTYSLDLGSGATNSNKKLFYLNLFKVNMFGFFGKQQMNQFKD